MKTNGQNKKNGLSRNKKTMLGLVALLSIPATLWAVSDSTGTFTEWVKIGYYSSSSTSGGSSSSYLYVGNYHVGEASGSAAIGTFLNNPNSNSLVVGKWNKFESGAYFVVGNGPNGSNKKNAFEVHSNGDVIVNEPQGDIPMGIYGN